MRYKEDIHFFANACAAAQERLVLTFSTEDDQIASPYINEIKSLFTELKIQQKTAVPKLEESLSKQELELGLVRNGAEDRLGEITDLLLVEAGESDRKRIRNEETWNGKLKEPSLIEDVSKNIGNRFSASGLEDRIQIRRGFHKRHGRRPAKRQNAGISRLLPPVPPAPDRRYPVHRRKGQHAGGIFLHLQFPARGQAPDRADLRPAAEGDQPHRRPHPLASGKRRFGRHRRAGLRASLRDHLQKVRISELHAFVRRCALSCRPHQEQRPPARGRSQKDQGAA